MTIIESPAEKIQAMQSDVLSFLKNPENYRILMPSAVRSFRVENECAILNIQGLGDLTLKMEETEVDSEIKIIPVGKKPFDFHLIWNITQSDQFCMAKLIITADLNMMMKMMASGFLKEFAETQVHKLKIHFQSN